jgi:5-methylcytosine-specific restriction endonuclease McrA
MKYPVCIHGESVRACTEAMRAVRAKRTGKIDLKGEWKYFDQCLTCGLYGACQMGATPGLEIVSDAKGKALKAEKAAEQREQKIVKPRVLPFYLSKRKAISPRKDAEWWACYSLYISSPEWQMKRQKVIERDPICKGCEERRSTQAHHLTYKHFGNEFLFELIGVCKPCHDRFHDEEQTPPRFEKYDLDLKPFGVFQI